MKINTEGAGWRCKAPYPYHTNAVRPDKRTATPSGNNARFARFLKTAAVATLGLPVAGINACCGVFFRSDAFRLFVTMVRIAAAYCPDASLCGEG